MTSGNCLWKNMSIVWPKQNWKIWLIFMSPVLMRHHPHTSFNPPWLPRTSALSSFSACKAKRVGRSRMMLEHGQGRIAGDLYEKGEIKEYVQGQSKGTSTLYHGSCHRSSSQVSSTWSLLTLQMSGLGSLGSAELTWLLSSELGAMSSPASHPILRWVLWSLHHTPFHGVRLTPSYYSRSSPVDLFKQKGQEGVRRWV